jgi:hypothetical protein
MPLSTMRSFVRLATVWIALLLPVHAAGQAPPASSANETYERAEVDGAGDLVITTTDGRSVRIPRNDDQAGFSSIRIAPDRTAVGARADYDNCCTSYPLARQLLVYSKGRLHRFKGIELPIFEWGFVGGKGRVAFGQTTAHFGCAMHYELYDIDVERQIASVDMPLPCGQIPNPKPAREPKWVRDLNASWQDRRTTD